MNAIYKALSMMLGISLIGFIGALVLIVLKWDFLFVGSLVVGFGILGMLIAGIWFEKQSASFTDSRSEQ